MRKILPLLSIICAAAIVSVSCDETTVSGEDPVTNEIILEPSSLTFDGDGAEPQNVKVTMNGSDYTWSAAVEDAVKDWISIESTEGNIKVTVTDNPDATLRKGKINVSSSDPSVKNKVILVTQQGKSEIASINVKDAGELKFGARDRNACYIYLTVVNCNWEVGPRDADGKVAPWLKVEKGKDGGGTFVKVTVAVNTGDERKAYVVISSDAENVPAIKVPVTQDKGLPSVSNLTENVTFAFTKYANATTGVAQEWDKNTTKTNWSVVLFDDGITYTKGGGFPYKEEKYEGSGKRMKLSFTSPVVHMNSQRVYYIPDEQDYTVNITEYANDPVYPYTFEGGRETNYYRPETASLSVSSAYGTWYNELQDSEQTISAPVIDGTMHVERTGADYTITFTLKDDAGHSMTGTYKGEIVFRQSSDPLPDPSTVDPKDDEPEVLEEW